MHAYAVEALVEAPGSVPGGSQSPGSTTGGGCRASSCRSACCSCSCRTASWRRAGGGLSSRSSRSERRSGRSPSRPRRRSISTRMRRSRTRSRTTPGGGGTRPRRRRPDRRRARRVARCLRRPLSAVRRRRAAAAPLGRHVRSASPCHSSSWARSCGASSLVPRCCRRWRSSCCRLGSPSRSSSTGSTRSTSSSTGARLRRDDDRRRRGVRRGRRGGRRGTLMPRGDLVVSLVVTGIVAVCFQPLRARVQRFVNRLMYGERDDPVHRDRRARTDAHELAAARCRSPARSSRRSGETLALQYVGIAVAGDGFGVSCAEYGSPGAESPRRSPRPSGRSASEICVLRRGRRAPPGARSPARRRPRTAGRGRRPRRRALAGAASRRGSASSSCARKSVADPTRPARRPRAGARRADLHSRGRPQPHSNGSPARRRAARLGDRAGTDDDRRRAPADLRPAPTGTRSARARRLASRARCEGVRRSTRRSRSTPRPRCPPSRPPSRWPRTGSRRRP